MMHDVKDEPEKSRRCDEQAEKSGPPEVYIASCGALCDVFWWARRSGKSESSSTRSDSSD